jgi:hypothetical protein
MAFHNTSNALFCSDQILDEQYCENIPKLFLSKDQASSVQAILQTGSRTPLPREPVASTLDRDQTRLASTEPTEISPNSSVDSGYMSEEEFEPCHNATSTRMVRLKSEKDLERFLSVRLLLLSVKGGADDAIAQAVLHGIVSRSHGFQTSD